MKSRTTALFCALAAAVLFLAPVHADTPISTARAGELDPLSLVPLVPVPSVDLQAVTAEDVDRELAGLAPRFAIPNAVSIKPDTDGQWQTLSDGTMVWRLRLGSPGAHSLNLGFSEFLMPPNGRLQVFATDGSHNRRAFTAEDNALHGELWTPVYFSDEIVVEVAVPLDEHNDLRLELKSVNVGYRGFDDIDNPESGSCNVDVVCPDGDDWRDEIPSVAAISTGGSLYCSGFMVNNTAQDATPYFMTAYHCGIGPSAASSLVAYWNYETSSCGGPRNGSLSQFNTGSFFRSQYSPSDFTLVELDSDPDPAWGITFAGWNRSGNEATTAIAIHHPSVDEKAISFEFQSTTTTSYLGTSVPGNGTHVRVADWDIGTTEGGSSGSPLFNQNHQVIGQLHGGYAACGNNSADWYGKFSVSWTGGGTSATRLSDWLDPGGTGANSVNTLVPGGCQNNGECDDGLFCNGAETCSGSCQAGSDPCPGQGCDEGSDSCVPLVCNNDGTCDSGEDCNNCGNDCISGSSGPTCGNNVCETADGEDCFNCPGDCNGKTNGNPSRRYCCGNDVGCSDGRCTGDGNTCSSSSGGGSYCCGDSVCEGAENSSNCSVDCGAGPVCGDSVCNSGEDCLSCPSDCASPETCNNGSDDDCDTDVDCDDSDCSSDPSCSTSCNPRGASCNSNGDCCSGRCKGNGTCK